eukprot:12548253-Alexandrium_andersonii.AAC.1
MRCALSVCQVGEEAAATNSTTGHLMPPWRAERQQLQQQHQHAEWQEQQQQAEWQQQEQHA